MKELLIATSNKGKLAEYQNYFAQLPFSVLSQKDVFPNGIEIEEPAETLEGNAIIKAMTIGHKSEKLTLADDTGLEVYALPGKLGVHTARYGKNDADRIEKLLGELANTPDEKRGAVFRSVIAIYDPERDKIRLCSGECRGHVARDIKEGHGFGFSPIFVVAENGKRFSEMDVEELHTVNHRGKALAKAKDILLTDFAEI